ncbi:MAG: NACHT domain-containing protein, partial [Anaerolineales bacterium]
MDVSKKKRLANITDEVGELHPLLHALLPKLQNVIDVEYTHGASEMGADFVISYRNEIFQNTEYIGVIAKVGKVVQDFSDIERQIDECSIPRTFFGGKEKICLDEIWVVVTQNISKGAQEKIHEKYSLRKITFVDGSRLANLIDKYMPVFWSQVSLEVGEYLTALHARNEEADRALSLIQIGDEGLYIKQDIYEFPRLEYRIKMRKKRVKPRKVSIEDILGQQKLVLIEGGMGSGKSKLIRRIVERSTRPEVFIQTKTVPVPTTYRELQDCFGGDIQRLIEETVPEELRLKHDDASFLVLIDGIDEKNVPMEEQIQALSSLTECVRTTTRTKAIVTSRYLAGLDNTCELEHEIARYELPPLSLRKTIEFLKALCTKLNLSNRLIEDLKRSQLFKELPRSPIAAILLAKLLNENPKDLPSNITELYAQYTELMLGRWDIDKGLQTMKEYQVLDHLLIQMSKNLL